MAVAALIIAILAFLMASSNLIVYLAKNVFSTHVVQMVPVEDALRGKSKPMEDQFEEFDMPSALDAAIDRDTKKRTIHSA